jgi:predicted TIM-barrel fold metal-dependent hydrolase
VIDMVPGDPLPPVIDAHTHLFPEEVVRNRRRHLERDTWFGELYSAESTILVTVEDLIASMDAAGIERSIVCGWPWRDQGLCREHNDFMAELATAHPDRLSWLAIVNPVAPGADVEIARSVSLGAVGVGELNADAQGFQWELPTPLAAAAEAAHALDVPFLLHASEPVGHHYPGKGTATPEKLLAFFSAYPDLSVVAAHWGGGLPFHELMPEIAARCRNVVYDTAASTYLYRWNILPVVERMIGSGKILFGTDYPLLRQKPFLQRAVGSGLPAATWQDVLARNAARVFHLPMVGSTA